MIDARDFHDGPVPEGEPFALAQDPAPRFGVGPDGVESLRRALGLPAPPARSLEDFGDPESKW